MKCETLAAKILIMTLAAAGFTQIASAEFKKLTPDRAVLIFQALGAKEDAIELKRLLSIQHWDELTPSEELRIQGLVDTASKALNRTEKPVY